MNNNPGQLIPDRVREELSDWRRWIARVVVIGFAALAGLCVVALTWLGEHAAARFLDMQARAPWFALLWTPTLTAGLVWVTGRWFAGAAGSGIPQVLAAVDPHTPTAQRRLFVSFRLSIAKIFLTAGGLLAGLSSGREGPSVQIAAGVMHHARRWLPHRTAVDDRGLMVAGGAAGIAAAFNTPLGGVMFAIEELSRRPEERSSGLLIAAIVLAGLIGVSLHGSGAYFGRINVGDVSWALLAPGVAVAIATGLLGGLFSRLLVQSLRGSADRFSRWRRLYPVRFAAGCGLGVAVICLVSGGAAVGSGYEATKNLLQGQDTAGGFYVLLRFLATWLTAWSGIPGGVFAPSLAIGAGIGSDVARLMGEPATAALIALGMAGFLAGVTQAPITAFIIVMEMVEGHALVLSLMACALTASAISRLISPPMYSALAELQLQRLPPPSPPSPPDPGVASPTPMASRHSGEGTPPGRSPSPPSS